MKSLAAFLFVLILSAFCITCLLFQKKIEKAVERRVAILYPKTNASSPIGWQVFLDSSIKGVDSVEYDRIADSVPGARFSMDGGESSNLATSESAEIETPEVTAQDPSDTPPEPDLRRAEPYLIVKQSGARNLAISGSLSPEDSVAYQDLRTKLHSRDFVVTDQVAVEKATAGDADWVSRLTDTLPDFFQYSYDTELRLDSEVSVSGTVENDVNQSFAMNLLANSDLGEITGGLAIAELGTIPAATPASEVSPSESTDGDDITEGGYGFLAVTVSKDAIGYRGAVDTPRTRNHIETAIRSLAGARPHRGKISVGADSSEWMAGASRFVGSYFGAVENGMVEFGDDQLILTGTLDSPETKAALQSMAERIDEDLKVDNQIVILGTQPLEAEPSTAIDAAPESENPTSIAQAPETSETPQTTSQSPPETEATTDPIAASPPKVENAGNQTTPVKVTIRPEGTNLLISGTVGTADGQKQLIRAASAGDNSVLDRLSVDNSTLAAPWLADLGSYSTEFFENTVRGELEVSEKLLSLWGVVSNLDVRDSLEAKANKICPEGYKIVNRLAIKPQLAGATPNSPVVGAPSPPENGIVIGKIVVYFDSNSDSISQTELPKVQEAAAVGTGPQGDEFLLVVSGYTDPFGDAGYNRKLSTRRTEAVSEKLISLGVPADRIRSEGHGEIQPAPESDGASSRRVEISIRRR